MDEIGIVKRVDGMMAMVGMEQKSACAHCEQDSCDITESGVETEALNLARAKVGQKVKVVMQSRTFYKGALFLYIIPLIALFAGAMLGGKYLPPYFEGIDPELLTAVGGIGALFISIAIVILISRLTGKETRYQSVIEEIIK